MVPLPRPTLGWRSEGFCWLSRVSTELNARLGMHRGMQGRNRKDEGGTQGKAVNRVDMAPLDPSSCNYLFKPCFGAVFSLIYPRETFVWHDATGRC